MSPLQLRSAPLTLPCPVCGTAMHVTYGQVIDEATVLCPHGHSVHLVDKGDGVRQLDRSFTQLNRQLRRMGRRR